MALPLEYAIIIRSKTRYETLLERFNTAGQARFYLRRNAAPAAAPDQEFEEYAQEHERLQAAVARVQQELAGVIKSKIIERAFLPSFIFAANQLVIVIGQDGLVANAAKYVGACPLLAVNPDPDRYAGVLLPFRPATCRAAVQRVLTGHFPVRERQLAEARLHDGQRLLAFNDLFIGASSHVSARYKISLADTTEQHSSSGIIVATPAGSTGWLSSIFNMTAAVESFAGNFAEVETYPAPAAGELLFVVREPFRSPRTQCGLVAGRLRAGHSLRVESLMPAGGVIFSDGVEADFLRFNAGAVATIGPAAEAVRLVQVA